MSVLCTSIARDTHTLANQLVSFKRRADSKKSSHCERCDIKFIIHVAAVSCAATAAPETKLANQILRKTRFRQALGVAFIFIWGRGGVQPLVRRSKYSRQLTYSGAEASVSAPVALFFRFISRSHAPQKERLL